MEHKSQYGDRQTVGAMYLKAQKENAHERVEVGDMSRELMSSLICDLNDTIQSKPHGDREYYICIHESKDLQMKNCIRRRILTSVYRPWPEDDTVVFRVGKDLQVSFCWCLPHWSEMDNILNNEMLFDPAQVKEIKAWKSFDMYHFGFTKCPMGNWIPNEKFKDQRLEEQLIKPIKILVA